jgi:hypothetical protein
LEKLLLEFKKTGQGGSCLLSGRRFSGKSLVLENILERLYASDEDNTRIEKIDGLDYENFASSSKIFERLGLVELVENDRRYEENKATTSKQNSKNKIIQKNGEVQFLLIKFNQKNFSENSKNPIHC